MYMVSTYVVMCGRINLPCKFYIGLKVLHKIQCKFGMRCLKITDSLKKKMINSITHILVQSIYTQFLIKILGEDWFGDYEVSICKLGYS